MKQLIPHTTVTLAVVMFIFMILDAYNPLMNFEFNQYSQKIINIFCIISFINGIYTICIQRKQNNKKGMEG